MHRWIPRMSKLFGCLYHHCCRHTGTLSILMCSTHVNPFFMNWRKKESHVAIRKRHRPIDSIPWNLLYVYSTVYPSFDVLCVSVCICCIFRFVCVRPNKFILCFVCYKQANQSTLASRQYFTFLVDKSRLYLHFRHMENKISRYILISHEAIDLIEYIKVILFVHAVHRVYFSSTYFCVAYSCMILHTVCVVLRFSLAHLAFFWLTINYYYTTFVPPK